MNMWTLLPSLLAQTKPSVEGTEQRSWLAPLEFAEWFGELNPWISVPVVLLVVFVIPFLLGWAIAKSIKMPTYAWRIGLILCSISAAFATIGLGWPPRLGVDLKGGWILIYQIEDPTQQGAGQTELREESSNRAALIEKLKRRLNPDGLKEISIRPYGLNEVEIIVPETDPAEIRKLKDQIRNQGVLRFLILAERTTDARLFEVAREQNATAKGRRTRDVKDGEQIIGRWVEVGREDRKRGGVFPVRVSGGWNSLLVRNGNTGELLDSSRVPSGEIAAAKYLQQQNIERIDVLMKVSDRYEVTGKDLRDGGVFSSLDENGYPSVNFNFRAESASSMGGLTSQHIGRQLAIVLDDKLLSLATIRSQITDSGRITGRFSQEEVDFIVRILKAGSLPAKLVEEPVYEDPSDPTLGAENIRQGAIAIVISLVLVFLFCLVYYRFAGIVASLALVLNILLTLGVMILFGATLTMPGLAGFVLTVGMSVDSNVLIFERIREELAKGASLRMAIRNGFDRASSTIIDSNLTTLLTAIILYVIGTDQLVGFAVTLTLGIITSMFTAVFVSRVIFEVCERTGVIRSLHFMQFLTRTNIDFVRYMGAAATVSVVLIGIGLAAAFYRGNGIFDIDLRGGTSIQVVLNEPATAEEIRAKLAAGFEGEKYEGSRVEATVKPVGAPLDNGEHRSFRVDTIIPDTDRVQKVIAKSLVTESGESMLARYRVTVVEGKDTAALRDESAFFTALNQEADQDPTPKTDAPSGEAATAADATKEGTKTAEQETADAAKSAQDKAGGDLKTDEKPKATEETVGVTRTLKFEDTSGSNEGIDQSALRTRIESALRELKIETLGFTIDHPDWNGDAAVRRSIWNVNFSTDAEEADQILAEMQKQLDSEPIWPASKKIGGQIAGDFVRIAIVAITASLLGIIAYIWFRFQNVTWGFAAVVALVHDVLFMLAAIAVSYWFASAPAFTGLTEFKIDLTVIAAFLTLIGYSINDTIVIFDRMREIKGKLPFINRNIVNESVNQTLSRSILTFLTVFIVVAVLYAAGGPGIHGFAYAMLVGTFVGMYSTVFIAAPFLLWIVNRAPAAKKTA